MDLTRQILNTTGSPILWWIARHLFQIGFFFLEGVWATVSVWALLRPRPV